jgi:hypothetical protein
MASYTARYTRFRVNGTGHSLKAGKSSQRPHSPPQSASSARHAKRIVCPFGPLFRGGGVLRLRVGEIHKMMFERVIERFVVRWVLTMMLFVFFVIGAFAQMSTVECAAHHVPAQFTGLCLFWSSYQRMLGPEVVRCGLAQRPTQRATRNRQAARG